MRRSAAELVALAAFVCCEAPARGLNARTFAATNGRASRFVARYGVRALARVEFFCVVGYRNVSEGWMTDQGKPALFGGRPVRQQPLPIFRLDLDPGAVDAVGAVLTSGRLSRGPLRERFAADFCRVVGADHAVVVSSGTAALHLALESLGLGRGGSVIVPSLSFAATALAVEHCGLTPVFAEVEPETMDLSPGDVERRIDCTTRAIVPVHYGGQAADLEALYDLARRRGLAVVEDAAHAAGAAHGGHRIGSSPAGAPERHAVAFSLFATKNTTAGEGGVITTADPAVARRAERLRGHGIETIGDAPRAPGYYDVVEAGYNYHLSDLNIALGIHHLRGLESRNEARRRAAAELTRQLEAIPCVIPPRPRRDHVFHLYTVQLELEGLTASRDTIVEALLAEGIQVGVYYHPIHTFTYFQRRYGTRRGDLPVTERTCDRLLTLPMYPDLTGSEIADIAAALSKVIAHFRRREVYA